MTTPAPATRSSATRCSATSSSSRPSFTGIAAHRLFGANVAFHDQTAKIDGHVRLGQLLSGPRPRAGSGPPDRFERRSRAGRIERRRAQPLVLGVDVSRRTPASSVDTLIVNGRPMTIVGVAPAGLRRHDGRQSPADLRADHDARPCSSPGFNAFDNRRSYWAYLFAPAETGRQHRFRTRRDRPSLSRDRQRRRSAASEGHERADPGALQVEGNRARAGRARAEPSAGKCLRAAHHPALCRRASSC